MERLELLSELKNVMKQKGVTSKIHLAKVLKVHESTVHRIFSTRIKHVSLSYIEKIILKLKSAYVEPKKTLYSTARFKELNRKEIAKELKKRIIEAALAEPIDREMVKTAGGMLKQFGELNF